MTLALQTRLESGPLGLRSLHLPGEPVAVVRRAAEQLVQDFGHIRRQTDDFRFEPLAEPLVAAAASRCVQRCAASGVCGEEAQRPLAEELWRIAGEHLSQSWLLRRAREKPRGYAGDHELMSRICEPSPSETPLGRAIDAFFLSQAAALAVRTRSDDLAAAIVVQRYALAGPLSVVSVGSGPGIDVARAVSCLPVDSREDIHVTLLDYDPEALDAARDRLRELLDPSEVLAIRENLARLTQTRRARSLPDADVLICPGLFDYLDEDTASGLLRLFYERLRPGGVALVGNFAPHCPSRAFMEWFGSWYLIYRDQRELERLASRAGLDRSSVNVLSERMGVDLFLEIRRPDDGE